MGGKWQIRGIGPAAAALFPALLLCGLADAAFALSNEAGVGPDASSHRPALVTAREDLFLAVFLNGYDTQKLAAFHRFADGCMTIAPEDLKEFNIRAPDTAMHASGGVCLEKLPGVTYRYDANAQNIHLKTTDEARTPLEFDARRPRATPTASGQDLSAVFNYALFASAGADDIATNAYPHYQGVSASVDGTVFSNYGAFSQSFTANSTASAFTSNFVRLDTRWRYDDPDTLVAYSAGDIISGSLNWTTSLRMGGVQIRRDFQLRPDLVTQPLPQFSGSAAVPSTVEVFANQTRAFSQDIAGGPFAINNIPIATGPSTMRIVLRDATGKETVTEYATYASTNLIAPGLLDYSVEAGFARQDYGLSSDRYDGAPIGSASFRYGITPRITVEGHAEGGAGLANAGAGLNFGLWHYGVVSFALSASGYEGAIGGQAYGSFETSLWGARLMVRALQALGDYRDLASATQPKCSPLLARCRDGSSLSRRQDQASLSLPLSFDEGSLNLGYVDSLGDDGAASKVGTASYGRPFLWDGQISFNLFNDFGQKNAYGAYAAVTYSWGKHSASALAEASNGASGVGGSFSRSLGQEAGSYGYSVTALEGPHASNTASASYRASAFQVSAGVVETGRSAQVTAQADGAIAFLNGVRFANRIDDSFAVVDAGVANARVLYENNPIGETDADGALLIPSLRARQQNSIAIDPASLPVQADMPDTKQIVTPAARGGVTVRFKGEGAPASAMVSFKDGKGDWLAAGSEAFVNGGETRFIIGYDGESYLTGLSPSNTVLIKKPDGSQCAASFDFVASAGRPVRIEGVACRAIDPQPAARTDGARSDAPAKEKP